jgi:ribosomal-protein-alanine N-acetyltransferase
MLELNFQPFPELKTNRLVLRELIDSDTEAIMYMRQDEAVMRYLDRPYMKDMEQARAFVEVIKDLQGKNNAVQWIIAPRENPAEFMGFIGYWNITKEHYRAEIGYMLNKKYWQQGYMKEALSTAIDYAFDKTDIHSIEANINPANIASRVVLERAGFRLEAQFRENYYFKGKFIDSHIYCLLRSDVRK